MDQEGLKWKKVDLAERLVLAYYNSYLFEHGVITEAERNRMAIEIKNRKPRTDRDSQQER